MSRLPYFYFPTTAVFVDDNKSFLNAIKHRLSSSVEMDCFINPLEALNAIQHNKIVSSHTLAPSFHCKNPLDEIEVNSIQQGQLGFQWDVSWDIPYNSDRFSAYSVLIIDQMMPELDGINFCRQFKNSTIKKIMLTSNTDYSTAVGAFNEGLIDYFLLKNVPDLEVQLLLKIKEMQQTYFSLKTEHIFSKLMHTMPILYDPMAVAFFEKIKEELQAVEGYLLDSNGSFLFLNQDGVATTLAVASDNVLNDLSHIAEDQDEHTISKILLSKKKLVYFPKRSDHMRPASEWHSFLHHAEPYPGQDGLFYALITDPVYQPIQLENVRSYQAYVSGNKNKHETYQKTCINYSY